MDSELQGRLIAAACRIAADHAVQFDALDAAIGDGDHGTNLKRALAGVDAAALAATPLPAALAALADRLEGGAGGAGGRFYGAFLRGMGGAAPAGAVDVAALAAMLKAGVAAVQAAGGARKGDKTLLDVLIPVAEAVERAGGRGEQLGARLVAAAGHGLHQTSRIEARQGLAADLGPASVNHIDPGACSAALFVGALVSAAEGGAAPGS